ncbi:MAG: cation transporter [Eubacterium sp.]|nr:cation transporter [Eubacterium sp.]
MNSEESKIAMKTSIVSIVGNLMLSVFKLIAGLIANSGAMISDAVHSASDVFSTLIVIIGVKISSKEADEDHPYGHERFEPIAAGLLSMVLAVVGFEIGMSGVKTLIAGHYDELAVPGVLAIVAAAVSIVAKEAMYRYTRINADRIGSTALKADAWHHRSDALSSVGALIGIIFARAGWPVMDSVASVVICVFILKAAIDIYRESLDRLVDKSADEKVMNEIRDEILQVDGVVDVDDLKTRLFGNKMYVDVEIVADGALTLTQSHEIAEAVHMRIETRFPETKHCMVHVNPDE